MAAMVGSVGIAVMYALGSDRISVKYVRMQQDCILTMES